MTRFKKTTLAMGVAIAVLGTGAPAMAQDSDVAALEARVAELEAMLQKLLDEKEAPAAAAPAPKPEPAAKPSAADSSYKFGGFVRLDAKLSEYSAGDLAPGSAGTQFYIPGTIPVGTGESSGPDLNVDAKATRLNFSSNHKLRRPNSSFTELLGSIKKILVLNN